MAYTQTYTSTFVRNEFMKLDILGLVGATIRLPIVRRVVEHGITNQVLDWLEIYLHDGSVKRASIRLTVDWNRHVILTNEQPDAITTDLFPRDEEVTSATFAKLIAILRHYKKDGKLTYWYNVGWTSNPAANDAACGITRGGTLHEHAPSMDMHSKKGKHELLDELRWSISLDPSWLE